MRTAGTSSGSRFWTLLAPRFPCHLGLLVRRRRPDDQLGGEVARVEDDRHPRSVRREGGSAGRPREVLPALAVDLPSGSAQLPLGFERPPGQLGPEAVVEGGGGLAEDAAEGVVEAARGARRHPRPEVAQAPRAGALLEPFEIGGAEQVGHRHAAPGAGVGGHPAVVGELPPLRPAAQDRRPQVAVRPPRAGEAPLDQGGIPFEHPAGRRQGDRPHRGDLGEQAPRRVARRPQHVDEVGLLVGDQQLGPVGVVAELGVGAGRARPQHHARPAEEGEGHAVGVGDRIGDHHVHHLRRVVADLGHHPLADRLQPRRRPPRPGLGRGRVVDPEVRRRESAPVGGGALGAGRGGKQDGEDDEQRLRSHREEDNPGQDPEVVAVPGRPRVAPTPRAGIRCRGDPRAPCLTPSWAAGRAPRTRPGSRGGCGCRRRTACWPRRRSGRARRRLRPPNPKALPAASRIWRFSPSRRKGPFLSAVILESDMVFFFPEGKARRSAGLPERASLFQPAGAVNPCGAPRRPGLPREPGALS